MLWFGGVVVVWRVAAWDSVMVGGGVTVTACRALAMARCSDSAMEGLWILYGVVV